MLKSLIAALDFTERKRAVNELRKNEARLEEAQRIAHFGWWERDFSTNRVLLSVIAISVEPDSGKSTPGALVRSVLPENSRHPGQD